MKKTLVQITCPNQEGLQACKKLLGYADRTGQFRDYEFIMTTPNFKVTTLEYEIMSKAKELASSIINKQNKFKPDEDAEKCSDNKHKVEIKDVFMFPFGEYAIKVNDLNDEKVLYMDNDYIQAACPKFLKDPLMWIAYKIIRRRFYKK